MVSSDYSTGAIQAFVDTLGFLLCSNHSVAFCRAAESMPVSEFAKTWIGVNFIDTSLVSLKLYFTVYEALPLEALSSLVGNTLVAEDCLKMMVQFEPCLDPKIMGSGYTICFKLSLTGGGAFGFYVRSGDEGVFRHFTEQGWFDKSYFYVSDREQLEKYVDKIGMPDLREFSSLEIGNGRSHGLLNTGDSIKVVPEGSFSDVSSRLFTETEQQVISAVERRFSIIATCGGVYCPPLLKSVYFATRERVRTFSAFLA